MSNLFNIVLHHEDEKYHICLINQKVIDQSFDTYKEALEYVEKKDWQLIVNVCALIVHNALIVHGLINPSNPQQNEKVS